MKQFSLQLYPAITVTVVIGFFCASFWMCEAESRRVFAVSDCFASFFDKRVQHSNILDCGLRGALESWKILGGRFSFSF
jgi:hypothetical protein